MRSDQFLWVDVRYDGLVGRIRLESDFVDQLKKLDQVRLVLSFDPQTDKLVARVKQDKKSDELRIPTDPTPR